jgi:hypothetical protein
MEEKMNVTNSGFYNHHTNKNKLFEVGQNFKKFGIKKYNSKTNTNIPKRNEKNDIGSINDTKQKQIKQCFLDLGKEKESKEKNIKDEIKLINIKEKEDKQKQSENKNKSELKGNKNIKVNNERTNIFDKIRNINISLDVEKSYSNYFKQIINLQKQKNNYKNIHDKKEDISVRKERKSSYSNKYNKRYFYYPDEFYINRNSDLHSKSHISKLFDTLRKKC